MNDKIKNESNDEKIIIQTKLSDYLTNNKYDKIKPVKLPNGKEIFQRKIEDPPVDLESSFSDYSEEEEESNESINHSEVPADGIPSDLIITDEVVSEGATSPGASSFAKTDPAQQEFDIDNSFEKPETPEQVTQESQQMKSPSPKYHLSPRNSPHSSKGFVPPSSTSPPIPQPLLSADKKSPLFDTNRRKPPKRTVSWQFCSGFVVLFVAILIGIFSITKLKQGNEKIIDPNDFERLESQLIFQLNDCISPTESIPITSEFNDDFIKYIAFESKYIKISNSSFVVSIPHRTLFCNIVKFCDLHPDLCGLIIVWLTLFFLYVYYIIANYQTHRIYPMIVNLLKSKDGQMSYIDDIRRSVESSGNNVFWTWGFIKRKVEKTGSIKTVRMADERPFWSLK